MLNTMTLSRRKADPVLNIMRESGVKADPSYNDTLVRSGQGQADPC